MACFLYTTDVFGYHHIILHRLSFYSTVCYASTPDSNEAKKIDNFAHSLYDVFMSFICEANQHKGGEKMKRITLCVFLLVAMILLSGCLKMHIDVVWKEDNSGTIATTVGITKSALNMMGGSEADMQEQFRESITQDGGDYEIKNFSDSEYSGIIATIKIDDLTSNTADATDQLRFRSSGEGSSKTFTVSGEFDTSDLLGGTSELAASGVSMSDVDMKISISMPGKITSHNATQQKGNTLSWDLASASSVKIEATSTGGGGGGFMGILMWIVFAISILALLAIGALIILKNRKTVPVASQSAQPPQQAAPEYYGSVQPPQQAAPEYYGSAQPPQQAAPEYYGSAQPPQQAAPYSEYRPDVPVTPIQCNRCGATLTGDAKFCPACGYSITPLQ